MINYKYKLGDSIWFPVWDWLKLSLIPVEFKVIEVQLNISENHWIEKYKIYSEEHNITIWRNVDELFDSFEKCENK